MKRAILGLLGLIFTASLGCGPLKLAVFESRGPFRELSPRKFPYFEDNGDLNQLEKCILRQIEHFRQSPSRRAYWLGDRQVSQEHVKATLERFVEVLRALENGEDLNELLRAHFEIYEAGGGRRGPRVVFTGYYEPELEGSLTPDETFAYPIYRRPDDLVVLEKNASNNNSKSRKVAVRIRGQEPVPYYTRREIDEGGALAGKDLEIAYLKDPLDRYVLHVQGSGKIRLRDDQVLGVHFAASNYYPYRSLRVEMIEDGVLSAEDASMDSIRRYFSEYPEQLDDFLNRNERYTFFEVKEGGVVGSLGVELTPGRSIATDKHLFPAGGLAYVETRTPELDENDHAVRHTPFSRFVVDQDEGGAIRGPHRVDIFWGSGEEAGAFAGRMNQEGKLYLILLKGWEKEE